MRFFGLPGLQTAPSGDKLVYHTRAPGTTHGAEGILRDNSHHEKSGFQIQAEYYPFRLLWGILHRMSLTRGYAFSKFLFRVLMLADWRHRRRTRQHILHSGVVPDAAAARRLARASTAEFAKLLVEIVKMDQLYTRDKFSIEGPEESVAYVSAGADGAPGGQTIFVTAHYGNWEAAGTGMSELVRRPMSSIMRPFANPRIGKLIVGHRAGNMHELIDKNAGLRPVLRAVQQKRNITILIDQHASRREGVVCEFFGHPARVHMTPALLHLRTGLPIVPALVKRLPGNDFRFVVRLGRLIRHAPTDDKNRDVAAISQLCISELERMIREAPEQWLWAPRHWLDINRKCAASYRNWKPSPPPSAKAFRPGAVSHP